MTDLGGVSDDPSGDSSKAVVLVTVLRQWF